MLNPNKLLAQLAATTCSGDSRAKRAGCGGVLALRDKYRKHSVQLLVNTQGPQDRGEFSNIIVRAARMQITRIPIWACRTGFLAHTHCEVCWTTSRCSLQFRNGWFERAANVATGTDTMTPQEIIPASVTTKSLRPTVFVRESIQAVDIPLLKR